MKAQILKMKEEQSLNLVSSIVSIDSCTQFFACGCIDDSVKVWRNKLSPFEKQPVIQYHQSISGILDIAFTHNSTHMATLSLDSSLKIWDLDTNLITFIDTPMLSAWKIRFLGDNLITCGDLGKIFYYDIFSKETVKKFNLDDNAYLTSITTIQQQKKVVVGNVNGQIYILSNEGKQDTVNIKSHNKAIRCMSYSNNNKRIFTSSDDTRISMVDLKSLKTQKYFEGHKQRVSSVKVNPNDQNIIYSCSLDKTIKIWDIRVKNFVSNYTSSGPLWSLQLSGKHLLIGGQLGILQILTLQ